MHYLFAFMGFLLIWFLVLNKKEKCISNAEGKPNNMPSRALLMLVSSMVYKIYSLLMTEQFQTFVLIFYSGGNEPKLQFSAGTEIEIFSGTCTTVMGPRTELSMQTSTIRGVGAWAHRQMPSWHGTLCKVMFPWKFHLPWVELLVQYVTNSCSYLLGRSLEIEICTLHWWDDHESEHHLLYFIVFKTNEAYSLREIDWTLLEAVEDQLQMPGPAACFTILSLPFVLMTLLLKWWLPWLRQYAGQMSRSPSAYCFFFHLLQCWWCLMNSL